MRPFTRACFQAALSGGGRGKARAPGPGSSLHNPRSHRTRVRRALAAGAAQQQLFEEQAAAADIGGSSASSSSSSSSAGGRRRLPRSRRQRAAERSREVGAAVAERARHLTDAEWEAVPLADKHAFARHMSRLLKEHPTQASEQQRRRYFETTMADPRDADARTTVTDPYERLKLGLPLQLKHPRRAMGVTDALFASAEGTVFDRDRTHELENAMTHVKQVFADYMRKRRAGTSTEAERRQLAHLTADLNAQTQRHLATIFRTAEERLRTAALSERRRQLSELARLRQMASRSAAADPGREGANGGGDDDTPTQTAGPADEKPRRQRPRRREREQRLAATIHKAVGLDAAVVDNILSELRAQEEFMQFCEVFARLTVGAGFTHTPADEGLDAYTESLKRLYSVDAAQLSTLDVVQYLAAKEDAHPVEWARRWYERAILLPLQNTPEYRRLEEIRRQDMAALRLRKELEAMPDTPAGSEGGGGGGDGEGADDAVVLRGEQQAATLKAQSAINLAEKMFLRADDPRLASLHERRLRYLAYLQMERQIRRARDNARLFEGVEKLPEAARCRELYAQLLQRRRALAHSSSPSSSSTPSADTAAAAASAAGAGGEGEAAGRAEPAAGGEGGGDGAPPADLNVYNDPVAAALFEEIRDITAAVIRRQRRRSRAAAKAARAGALLRQLQGAGQEAGESDGGGPAARSAVGRMRAALAERRARVSRRLLAMLESDVRSDVQWLEAMEEAQRPPLLPVPDAGMSYVSAADVAAWAEARREEGARRADPFRKTKAATAMGAELFGQPWPVPDKPVLFWGTGVTAVQQALQHAAEDAERERRGEPLAPPYPCPENPWGWRLVKDILDD